MLFIIAFVILLVMSAVSLWIALKRRNRNLKVPTRQQFSNSILLAVPTVALSWALIEGSSFPGFLKVLALGFMGFSITTDVVYYNRLLGFPGPGGLVLMSRPRYYWSIADNVMWIILVLLLFMS